MTLRALHEEHDDGRAGDDSAVVIGGELSGLVTAAYLARAGRSVLLCEAAHALGVRARTRSVEGFHFNQGLHALYLGGPARDG